VLDHLELSPFCGFLSIVKNIMTYDKHLYRADVTYGHLGLMGEMDCVDEPWK